MREEMQIDYREAMEEDAEMLVEIYNKCFFSDYVRYGECPAYGRTVSNMRESIKNNPKIIMYYNSIPIGVISYSNRGYGHYFVGCLCIAPMYQGKGFGTMAFKHFQEVCGDWRKISLITPADKAENIHFYWEKCEMHVEGAFKDGHVDVVQLCVERDDENRLDDLDR